MLLKISIYSLGFILILTGFGFSEEFQSDTVSTSQGVLKMTFIGHGTLMFTYNDMVIHVDPVSRYADYSQLPDADLILITHEHGDHLDPGALEKIITPETTVLLSQKCLSKCKQGQVMQNGDATEFRSIEIKAVPAYNIEHMRSPGNPYHPKGEGNGYVLTFADTRVYVAGDTENIPEMKHLSDIDIAFLPMNLPYTMSPEMAADVARRIEPSIVYPYHYGQTDPQQLVRLLADTEIEVRIRDLR
jgi:L-ascorbate metabolism protein UlaG (beta-lactamase superfamily)